MNVKRVNLTEYAETKRIGGNTMANIIDTRDLQNRLEELEEELENIKDELEEAEQEEDADFIDSVKKDLSDWLDENQEELEELQILEREIPEWLDGNTLINDDYFEQYAQDLAEDLGMDRSQPWPYSCIDWSLAADELKQDYSQIEYQGETYWFRN